MEKDKLRLLQSQLKAAKKEKNALSDQFEKELREKTRKIMDLESQIDAFDVDIADLRNAVEGCFVSNRDSCFKFAYATRDLHVGDHIILEAECAYFPKDRNTTISTPGCSIDFIDLGSSPVRALTSFVSDYTKITEEEFCDYRKIAVEMLVNMLEGKTTRKK